MSSHADKLSPFFNFKHAPVREIWPEKMLHYLLIFIIFIPILILILVPIHIIYSQTLLHIDAFTHRLSHTSVTQSHFHTKTFCHTDTFRQQKTLIHTQTHLQTDALHKSKTGPFTHKQAPLHTNTFTQKHFHTQTPSTHKRFYTQTLLHKSLFTHRRLLHTSAFTHNRFDTQSFTQTCLHTESFHAQKI